MKLILALLVLPLLLSCHKKMQHKDNTKPLSEDTLKECGSLLVYDKDKLYRGVDSIDIDEKFGTILAISLANGTEDILYEEWDREDDSVKRKLFVFAIFIMSSKIENPIRDDLYPLCRVYQREDGKLREEEIKDVIRNRSQYAAIFQPLLKKIITDTPEGKMIEDVWIEPLKERNPQKPFWDRNEYSMGKANAVHLLSLKLQMCNQLKLNPECRFSFDKNRDPKSLHYGLK